MTVPCRCLVPLAVAADLPPAAIGGKAVGLARLLRLGHSVPEGWVLPVRWYRRAARHREVRRAIALFRAHAATPALRGPLLAQVRLAWQEVPLPGALEAELAVLCDGTAFAVRSSGVGEDGRTTSAAGIHQSVLGAATPAALADAIRRCWASAWSEAAVAYRTAAGGDPLAGAMAVVIQRLVPAEVAGIAFSHDPLTLAPEVVVDAGRGLGEAVVAGRVEPEQFRLVRDGDGWRLRSVRPGKQRRTAEGEEPLASPTLTPAQAEALAARVATIAAQFGHPVDIEWARVGDRWWFLQARPIVRREPPPPPSAPATPWGETLWSNANLGEVLPGVTSPLTWSLVEPAVAGGLGECYRRFGAPLPAGVPLLGRFLGRAYFNLSLLQWHHWAEFGTPPAETNQTLGGNQPAIAVTGRPPASRWRRGVRAVRGMVAVAAALLAMRRVVPRVQRYCEQEEGRPLDGLDDAALAALWFAGGPPARALVVPFLIVSGAASGIYSALRQTIARWLPGAGDRLASGIVAGHGGITSAEHGYRLAEIGRIARCEPASAAYLRQWLASTLPSLPWQEALRDTATGAALARFLAEFGHRGQHELELAEPRWREDPAPLLRTIAAYLDAEPPPPDAATRRRRAAWEEVTHRLRAAPLRRLRLAILAALYGHLACLREAGKSHAVRLFGLQRRIALAAGERMRARGHLARPDDVFFLTQTELLTYLIGEGEPERLLALVESRREEVARWTEQPAPDYFWGDDPPQEAPPLPVTGEVELTGLPISGGRACGRARVVRSLAEGDRLRAGEILVAPSTDPAWTPLFLRAGGLVVEVGGFLSHGAIVAREYGLPAVANVAHATTRIPDGAWLDLDADTGRVSVRARDAATAVRPGSR